MKMLKTLKWIYKLGKLHERRRVKGILEQYIREEKPERPQLKEPENGPSSNRERLDIQRYEISLGVYNSVGAIIGQITEKKPVTTRTSIFRSQLDDDTPCGL